MTQDRDSERTAVYAAESAAFDGTDLEVVLGYEVIASLVAELTEGEWWPGPPVQALRARADARSSSTRCIPSPASGESATVHFAEEQTTIATAAHELAHALAGVEVGHGPVFREAYLDVVGVITNLDSTDRRHGTHVGQLERAFDAIELDLGCRQWADPPSHGPIAL